MTYKSIGKTIRILCCLLVAYPSFGQEPDEFYDLAPGSGFLFIRLILTGDFMYQLDLTNVESGEVFVLNVRRDSEHIFKRAGLRAWTYLKALPEGRYFVSRYTRAMREKDTPLRSETFEIAAHSINYAGDWTLRAAYVYGTHQARITIMTDFEFETLHRLREDYTELVKRWPVYLSMMGKDAMPLADFLAIVEEHRGSEVE